MQALKREILTTTQIALVQFALDAPVCIPVHTARALLTACGEMARLPLIDESVMHPDPVIPGSRADGQRPGPLSGIKYSSGNIGIALHDLDPSQCSMGN